MPLIMAGHVTVSGTSQGSERDITHLFNEPVLSAERLSELPFAYGALGHIHTPQSVGGSVFHYAGSPNRLTFTDEPDVKGANLVRLDGNALSVEQVQTPARKMLTVRPGDAPDFEPGMLVRVVLGEGETEVSRKLRRDIALAGARLVATRTTPKPPESSKRAALAQTVTAEDALRTWAGLNKVSDVDALVSAARELPGGAL